MENTINFKSKVGSKNGISIIGTPAINNNKEKVFSEKSFCLFKDDDIKKHSSAKELYEFINNKPTDKLIIYCKEVLENFFNIKNINYDIFKDVTTGEGNEILRIRRLGSSSLCGFLHFYSVAIKEKKITFPSKYFGESLTFDEAYFEYTNPCIHKGRDSSVDVVLLNRKEHNILFLELKFAEYTKTPKKIHPSAGYDIEYAKRSDSGDYCDSTYRDLFSLKINEKCFMIDKDIPVFCDFTIKDIRKKNGKIEKSITLQFAGKDKERNTLYLDGVKQIISHYIGIKRFIKNGRKFIKKNVENFIPVNIYYGEMVFDQGKRNKSKLEMFSKAYEKIASRLETNDIHFAKSIMTYQDVFTDNKDIINDDIRNFYYSL